VKGKVLHAVIGSNCHCSARVRRGHSLLCRRAGIRTHRRQPNSRAEQALGGRGAARAGVRPSVARAVGDEQTSRIGDQTGGRVFLFLYTDDLWRDFRVYKEKGVVFIRQPKEEIYGAAAVFKDLYGNLWDLIQHRPD
jgi:glyoxalase/bleomycin resistance protein/dioxygenase superfamily protein